MRVYRERLGVPLSWWLVISGCVVLLGTTLWAGLSLTVAALTYAGLEALAAATLIAWGSATIDVTADALTARGQPAAAQPGRGSHRPGCRAGRRPAGPAG